MNTFQRLLLATVFALGATLPSAWTQAQTQDYQAPAGAPFFLLTDTSYSSTEEAKVRLEMAGRDLGVLGETDGVDVALYRVAQPLPFLRAQKNLHRIELAAAMRPEGMANTLEFLWDSAWKKARKMWREVFASGLRKTVVEQAPQVKTSDTFLSPPPYLNAPAYTAPPGSSVAARFRYPLQFAKPAAPPKELKLLGSSSEFVAQNPGNVYIPLGKLAPGLYVVEAAVGKHRAVTLLFVSDTVAVSKTSAQQMLVWVAQRKDGQAAPKAQVVWSDLNGVLANGQTDAHGVAVFKHSAPQTSYAFGQDAAGGVFVSENFYYDSEIYNNKLYATTDRPLYRPGDEVNLKLYGREFTGARASKPMAASKVGITVLDAQGFPMFQEELDYLPERGAASTFKLPDTASAGGYEIRMRRGDDEYSAAFRVAYYVKPHFEILVEPAKATFKTGEIISGRVRLAYPDGKPVAKAVLDFSARAQVLTMVEGDLAYGGAFPLQLDKNQELITDSKGYASFNLPAAKEPSRLILSVLASDGAAQRVRSTKELLIERSASAYTLKPDRQFAAANESVGWRLAPADAAGVAQPPVKWVAMHQESQTKTDGAIAPGATSMSLQLVRPGSYTVQLRDAQDQLVGAAPFWVSGGELKPPTGSIEIVLDKARYKSGDVAKALITFPEPVTDALLTLERDSVEAYGRLQDGNRLATLRRLNDRQWEASVKVDAQFAPNMGFSVAYVYGGSFGFQNAGIAVEQPSVQISLKTDKASYQPGDTVTVDVQTTSDGKPVASHLTLGAVDEMVYVLQPEIAPSIQEFFYHARRNNVRTHSSLAFISYDEAGIPNTSLPRGRSTQERGVKLLERPRRDDKDTAYWAPSVLTDASGRARVSFKVPDALTRWRITARAFGLGAADGLVGEKRTYFLSDKPFYGKWTSPHWLREGDRPTASLAIFNQSGAASELQLALSGPAGFKPQTAKLSAAAGANFVSFPIEALASTGALKLTISQNGKTVDELETKLEVQARQWPNQREQFVSLPSGQTQLKIALPADATGLQAQPIGEGQSLWQPVADALLDYPYGCVEQTASRLIPLTLALNAMPAAQSKSSPLRAHLYAARLRLASMAGPNAVFGWWGNGTDSNALLSSYAYYADYLATQTLGMSLPRTHWERLIEIYAKNHANEPLAHRALSLWMMKEMGLPVATFASGLVDALQKQAALASTAAQAGSSWVLGDSGSQTAVALALAAQVAKSESLPWPTALDAPLLQARQALGQSPQLFAQALLLTTGVNNLAALQDTLRKLSEAEPTFDRAMGLVWLAKATQLTGGAAPEAKLAEPWRAFTTATGSAAWRWGAAGAVPAITLAEPAARTLTFALRYTTSAREAAALPATVARRLYRLERDGKTFSKKAVSPGDELSTTALYLDELEVASTRPLRWAIAELALPPGAFVEESTWGIDLGSADKAAPMARSVAQASRLGYTVAIDNLSGTKTVQHLLRFGQRGKFNLPGARVWRMYQPEGKAYEAGPASQVWNVQ